MLAKLAEIVTIILEWESHVIEDCPTVHEVEVLEDHADFLTFLTQTSTGQTLKCYLTNGHLSACWALQEVDDPDQGGFPGTRVADDSVNIAFFDCQINVFDCLDLAVLLSKCDRDIL